jgi:hypothetical protein
VTATECASSGNCSGSGDPCLDSSDCPEPLDETCDPASCEQTNEFRLILPPDAQNWVAYKLNASNPGQFFYNLIYEGAPNSTVDIKIDIPYPFVTQGAQAVHVYDAALVQGACVDSSGKPTGPGCWTDADCDLYPPLHDTCDVNCFVPPDPADDQYDAWWTINDWVYGNDPVDDLIEWSVDCPDGGVCGPDSQDTGGPGTAFCTLTLEDVEIPASGSAYVNLHLDYGLKGQGLDVNPCDDTTTDRYDKGNAFSAWGSRDAYVNQPDEPLDELAITDCQEYSFSHTDDTDPLFEDSVQNLNMFKRINGAFGSSWNATTGETGAEGVFVELWRNGPDDTDPPTELVEITVTDEDGYFTLPYTHRGKPNWYTVRWMGTCDGGDFLEDTVRLQSNGWSEVNFLLDTCTTTAETGCGDATSCGGGGPGGGNGGGPGGGGPPGHNK